MGMSVQGNMAVAFHPGKQISKMHPGILCWLTFTLACASFAEIKEAIYWS